MLQVVFEAVIPGGKLQAPVASRTCWVNWQGVLLVDPVVTPLAAHLASKKSAGVTQLPPVVVVVVVVGK